ncbi:hypothetical protein OH768_25960 [Streptomyces sp. NBC_01622]|nr:hypothetical protein OH768_25960 [Streptomyces sp. NBC_01622]
MALTASKTASGPVSAVLGVAGVQRDAAALHIPARGAACMCSHRFLFL